MVRDIVFHLGDCKTGTTSIQAALAEGAWAVNGVAGADISYPARFNHIPAAKTLSVPSEAPHEAARFGKLREAFAVSDAAHGVISAEHFEFVDPHKVKAAIERHFPGQMEKVRLVAYVRPHADRLMSTFAERAKKGIFMRSPEAMHEMLVKDGLLFYAPRFRTWRALFGEAFTLRPFVRDRLYKGDVVQDFFSYLFGGEGFDLTRPTDQNESLSVEDIAMMRAIHGYIRKKNEGLRPSQQSFGWYMSDLLGQTPRPGGTKPRLHRALAEQVVQTYAEDAAALDAEFFDGTPMSDALAAAPEKAVAEAQSFKAEDHFGAADLRLFEAWAKLLTRMMAADPAHFDWAVRPARQRAATPPAFGGRTQGNKGKGKGAGKGPGKGGGKGAGNAGPKGNRKKG